MPNPARLAVTVAAIRARGGAVRSSALPGVTRSQVRAALTAGVLISLRRGVVAVADDWWAATPAARHELALQAALLAYPESWASHTSALQVHGVEVLAPFTPDGCPVVHISRTGTTVREPGLVVHGQAVRPSDVTEVRGLPTSTLVRATIETSARRSLEQAVAVMDAGMRRRLAQTHADARRAALDPSIRAALWDEWDDAIAPYTRHRWVTTVREALRWAEPAAESYLESISRVRMVENGIPRPACGVPMLGDDGRTYWLDFWWERARVAGEADGRLKYRDPQRVLAEKDREEALSVSVTRFVRWGMPQVVPDPRPMLARVRAALDPSRASGWS